MPFRFSETKALYKENAFGHQKIYSLFMGLEVRAPSRAPIPLVAQGKRGDTQFRGLNRGLIKGSLKTPLLGYTHHGRNAPRVFVLTVFDYLGFV